jgi:riboflavin kinase, archaea type
LEGTVFAGTGKGRKFMMLSWVKRQVKNQLDFVPFEGTLNLHLNFRSVRLKSQLSNAKSYLIEPEEGFCPGTLIEAKIDTHQVAIVLPQIPGYPSDVLEIISPYYLRDHLGLSDGKTVAVTVEV